MRGEVLQLSSNVNVTASNDAEGPHGCHILVCDFFEPHSFEYRYGSVNLDNVAVYNCSQFKKDLSGIKFQLAYKGAKKVTNSAFSHGLGRGVTISNSAGVIFENNVVHDFIHFGIIGSGQDFQINNNVVSYIKPYP